MRFLPMRSAILPFCLLSVSLLLASMNIQPAFCQVTSAAIHGTVTDPSEAVIPNAKVTALNTATGIAAGTTSNKSGFFIFPALQIGGPYTITVESPGFQKFERTAIELDANANLEENARLQVGTTLQIDHIDGSRQQSGNLEHAVGADRSRIAARESAHARP